MYVNMVREEAQPWSAAGWNAHWYEHSATTLWHELVDLKSIDPMTQYSLSWRLTLEG